MNNEANNEPYIFAGGAASKKSFRPIIGEIARWRELLAHPTKNIY